jgi:hypothetical protein
MDKLRSTLITTALLTCLTVGAQTFTWHTNKADAFQAATNGQRVLLIVGTAGCSDCEYVRSLCDSNATVHPVASTEYVGWYDDYQLSTEYKFYWSDVSGISFPLPLINIIEPSTPTNYNAPTNSIYRYYGRQSSTSLSNMLYKWASFTNAVLKQCTMAQGKPSFNMSRLTYGETVNVQRCVSLGPAQPSWTNIYTFTNLGADASKTCMFVDTSAPRNAFYRVKCAR